MAINIFQGGSKGSTARANSAANSTRAQAAKAALKSGDAVVSDSGNTAVKASGTLGKIGNTVGKIAGVASKFLPGIGGTIAKGIAGIFNDPEWWQSIPGDALTANTPLREVDCGKFDYDGIPDDTHTVFMNRAAIAEFTTYGYVAGTNTEHYNLALHLTPNQTTQYLMPEIRKVVNAIPLQSATAYSTVTEINATVYGLWRQLKKADYILKHGTTFIANLNDRYMFPVFATENAAWLQATINRLEEYLRSNVRLPHTLCEYFAWRYGRVYRSNDSAKSGLIVYNVVPFSMPTAEIDKLIGFLTSEISSSTELQQANTDMYNAYFDHDMQVEIRDDTQFQYDKKEFLLRTNCDIGLIYEVQVSTLDASHTHHLWMSQGRLQDKPVITDSNLDNPTTFMSSVVSTLCVDDRNHGTVLVPVACLNLYYVQDGIAKFTPTTLPTVARVENNTVAYSTLMPNDCTAIPSVGNSVLYVDADLSPATYPIFTRAYEMLWARSSNVALSDLWTCTRINSPILAGLIDATDGGGAKRASFARYLGAIYVSQLLKALDIYNAQVLCCFACQQVTNIVSNENVNGKVLSYDAATGPYNGKKFYLDLTALSIDMGIPSSRTVGIEQVYALANLVDNSRKTSLSYKSAEKLVAKDVANMVDKLDVAAAATK